MVTRMAVPAAVVSMAAAALAAGGTGVASARTAAPALRQCRTIDIPVAPEQGAPATWHVAAEYCTPYGIHASTVDVLVPGATYNHLYWDPAIDPSLYSYADKTLEAGRAVLDIDRLGTGGSSQPVSTDITATADVYALHQVILLARHVLRYSQVDVIGHSLGSIIAAVDAGTYPSDPTRLVLTGYLNDESSDVLVLENDLYPADQDPQFANSGLDSGYLTTRPGTRDSLFYYNGNPAVIAYDEAHKDVLSATEEESLLPIEEAPAGQSVTDDITAPVLLIVGQEDFFFCEGSGVVDCTDSPGVQAYEQPYFADTASLSYEWLPGTGHDLALSQSADRSFAMINAWLDSH
jgi:pimeloyl-ACP methyl ester carboxylesterase